MSTEKLFFISTICVVSSFGSCASEFNAVYKLTDTNYRYEYAKECFFKGKYIRAITLLNSLIIVQKGTENAQGSLYMLAIAQHKSGDYESAAQAFKRYVQSYPKGKYAELTSYYVGENLLMCTPEPRLDQSQTVSAIASLREFLDLFPDTKLKNSVQSRPFELQDKLVKKELYSAQLHYNLGPYFENCTNGGNNYEACIITAENALKDYPYSSLYENFVVLVMKSKFELAERNVEEKRLERYQDAEDECYGFINEHPDLKQCPLAEKFIKKCKEVTKTRESNSQKIKEILPSMLAIQGE